MSRLEYPIDWSRIPHLPCERNLPMLRIRPFPDEHFRLSREMIARVAETLPPGGRVQVLGAGRCQDIPVGALARRFGEVVLGDIDGDRLRKGVASQTDIADPGRIRLEIGDLSSMTAGFRALAEPALAGVKDPRTAVARLGEVMNRTHAAPVDVRGVFDMTVCSGVLTQVDYPIWKSAMRLLEDRFGSPFDKPLAEELRGYQRPMAHRLRLQLIEQLLCQTRGGGRIYLADTMRVAHLEIENGEWTAEGAYRMGAHENIADYLDKRVIIDDRREWNWVDLEDKPGRGRLWKVQALALTRKPGKAEVMLE